MTGPAEGLVVRPAGPDDLAAVVRIEHLSFGDPWSDEALLSELGEDPLRLPLVAVAEGSVIGFLMAWCVVDQLHVLNIATDPAWRRGGVASAMLTAAARRGRVLGLEEVTLEVRRSNHAARNFYLRHGFREVAIRPAYYQDNGEDAIIMTAPLAGLLPAE